MEEAFSQQLKEEKLELPAGTVCTVYEQHVCGGTPMVRDYFRKAALDALLAGETAGYRIRGKAGKNIPAGTSTVCGVSRRCRLRSPLSGLPKPMCF